MPSAEKSDRIIKSGPVSLAFSALGIPKGDACYRQGRKKILSLERKNLKKSFFYLFLFSFIRIFATESDINIVKR
jgi:hypothetical protein